MDNRSNWNNFNSDLKKEQDSTAQKNLDAFYQKYLPDYQAMYVEYDSSGGKFLQHAGVDKIFAKYNQYGSITSQIWIQEKVLFSNYPNYMFEYEKKSGAKGWAVCPHEKSDFIVFYMLGEITVFKTAELREWLTANLDSFKRQYRYDTDNKNVNVPKSVVMQGLKPKVKQLEQYQPVPTAS